MTADLAETNTHQDWGPQRSRTKAAIGAYGLPAIVGVTPDAVATAARIAPPPGISPSGVGYVASSLVATRRAPLRTASLAIRRRS